MFNSDTPEDALDALISSRGDADRLRAELSALAEIGGWFKVPTDPDWPMNRHCLGVLRGVGQLPAEPRVGIIGARRADIYGLEVTERLARVAVESGRCVVSGGAFGVDIAAHRAALAHGGRTVAVVGSGLTHLAPASHRSDFNQISERGAVLSPLPCSQRSAPWTFPYRNPWISGLCDTVLVVQAGLKSGALQTARAALSQGVAVWVVPGAMDHPLHKGCHTLVAEGARILVDERSWVDGHIRGKEGQLPLPSPESREPIDGLELWRSIGSEPVTVDELSLRTGREVRSLMAEITTLELSGWLRRGPTGGFMRAWPNET